MVKNNKHAVAMNLEALDCVERVDTGEDRITVVFNREEGSVDEFGDKLDPEYYAAVKNEIRDTMFQEETPIGNECVDTFPNQNEMQLRFVI